ncbi:MAG: response regulator, partial [Flavobacterium sp.]|nr:response regulator [Flavobacterium sp.]
MPQILIVEDQVLIANHIKNILTDCNYTNVELTFNLKDANLNLQQFEPRIILLDINVEGHDTGI